MFKWLDDIFLFCHLSGLSKLRFAGGADFGGFFHLVAAVGADQFDSHPGADDQEKKRQARADGHTDEASQEAQEKADHPK